MKLIICLFVLCIVALLIFFMIWEGKGFAPKKENAVPQPNADIHEHPHAHLFFDSEEMKFPSALNKDSIAISFSSNGQERSKHIEKSLRSLLSKIYLKFGGEDDPFDLDEGVNDNNAFQKKNQSLENIDADGAFGYRFKLESQEFYATPVIGYLLNIHIVKPGVEQDSDLLKEDPQIPSPLPFSRILHWKGPYIGFNAAMHFFSFLSVDASYSFHLVDFHHLFFDEILPPGSSGAQKIGVLRHYSNIGLGHTGLLGVNFVLGTKWKLGLNCKYKQFGTIESVHQDISEVCHTQWHSFQAAGELGVRF